MLAVFDHRREFCPPAAVRLGIEPEQLLVIHADTVADDHWAIDHALRSQAVAAALAWPGRLDDRTFRRWQLAAEEGGCLGLLLRPETARCDPSWADVRLSVGDCPNFRGRRGEAVVDDNGTVPFAGIYNKRLLRIVLLRCRGGNAGRGVNVELDDETYRVHSLDQRRWQVAN
jgi:hypothetical protein